MENPCQGCENLKERTNYISNKLRNSDVSGPHKELSLEELLRHHQDIEGQYRLLIEFAPDAIFIADEVVAQKVEPLALRTVVVQGVLIGGPPNIFEV